MAQHQNSRAWPGDWQRPLRLRWLVDELGTVELALQCVSCPARRPAAGSSIAAGLIAELAGFVSDVTSVQTAMISPNHSSGNRLTTRNGKTP
jgi:hypothetical protein